MKFSLYTVPMVEHLLEKADNTTSERTRRACRRSACEIIRYDYRNIHGEPLKAKDAIKFFLANK